MWSDRKGVITVLKAHSVFTKMNKLLKPTGGCVDMWSLCQNISGLSFTNFDLPALKYGRIMKMEATNEFFELMEKKHKNLVAVFQSVVCFWTKLTAFLEQVLSA